MNQSLRDLEQIQQNLEYSQTDIRVFIAEILPIKSDEQELELKLLETQNLVNTYWGLVIISHIQKKWIPDYKTYIWSWKLDDIIQEMQDKKANLLIIWNILKPIQLYNINEKLKKIWAKAWDRIDLILKIFEKNAKTTESRLQIELASIKHMWPRIFNMGMELWNQWRWWNKWSRWKWQTNTQIMKQHLLKREKQIRKELELYKKVRENHRKNRDKKWFYTVWIVWYTNAGKSSLMNILTNKGVLAENKLFATLWTSVWKMYIQNTDVNFDYKKNKEILLNDTIGFIRDLPPNLIQAFASTLEDSIESDSLLEVVDCWDIDFENKMVIVDEILNQIHATQKKIYVFNKIDLIWKKQLNNIKKKFKDFNIVFISTYNWDWILDLKNQIWEELNIFS